MIEMKINRKWFFVLQSGTIVLDWGQGIAQKIISGEFIRYLPKDYERPVTDSDLDPLIGLGRVQSFNDTHVILKSREE